MRWESVQFSAADVIRICVQVVLGSVFIMMMKSDIRSVTEGLSDIKQESKEERERSRAWQVKMEAECAELKVRIGILEQKFTDFEVSRDQSNKK